MNSFDQFMKGLFKKIVPWVALAFGVMLTIAGSIGIVAAKNQHYLSGDQAIYIVFLVFYWIVAICALACVVMKIVHKYSENNPMGNRNQGMYQQQNSYQQNNMAGNYNNYNAAPNVSSVQNSAPAGEKFCTSCGAKIPEGSTFCTNCGNKA